MYKNFEVLDSLNNEKGEGIVLCMSDEIFPIDRNNYYVPVSYINFYLNKAYFPIKKNKTIKKLYR